MSNKINEVIELANQMQMENKRWRWGQCVFNALHFTYPEVADRLRATDIDCFYNDAKADLFLETADKMLNSTPTAQGSDTTEGDSSKD